VSLRTVVLDVPPQDVITKDNVSIKVNAVVYFRVVQPDKAIVSVENYIYATSQLAQTTLRSILGQSELDELLAQRDKINHELQMIIDQHTEPWGIKISTVEVKTDRPAPGNAAGDGKASRSRARTPCESRSRRRELQASVKLGEAAAIIQKNPIALQLRYLQTLTEVASENNSTTIFPFPMELLTPFIDMYKKK